MAVARRVALYGVLGCVAAGAIAVLLSPAPSGVPPALPGVRDPERIALSNQVEADLMAGKFDALDAQAAQLRNLEIRYPGGYPKLTSFYAALGKFADKPCDCLKGWESHAPLDGKERQIKAWMAARPDSITAKIAMAELLRYKAYAIRGGHLADKVPDDAMAEYQAMMLRALAYIDRLNTNLDPEISAILFVGLDASGGGRDDVYALYAASVKLFPNFPQFYGYAANLLQPKWFGTQTDLTEFFAKLAADGSENAMIGYSFAAETLASDNKTPDLFSQYGIEWPVLKHALAIRQARYGVSNGLLNVELRLAGGPPDHAYAAVVARQIGDKWDPGVWWSWDYFYQTRTWALWQETPH